jgi:predicted membrane channel-forming protein YqfA (hemolysin III family)
MIGLILTLALVGFVVYAITTWIPMAAPFKTAIYVLVAVCLIWYLMQVFGVADLPLPRAR